MPTVSASDIVGFAPGTRGVTISPDDIVGRAPAPTYYPQTVYADDIAPVQPTAGEQSTLEAPEGSPQREDINRGVAGNIFAPPGAFARNPTLSESINASMPRSVQEAQQQEQRIPLAPPLPDQGAFEQGGVLGVTVPAAEAGGELVQSMMPHDWRSYLEQIYPPLAAAETGGRLAQGDISGIPLVGRIPEIVQAEQTPGFSKERYLTALRTLMDVGGLAGGAMEHGPSVLRQEPLAPEPPPTVSTGSGTLAQDVSRALERRFELQPTPPEAPPQLAPSVPIEQTLPQIPQEPPVFNPELGPATRPDFQMPLRTETAQISPPPGTDLQPIPLRTPDGGTPALDAATAQAQPPITEPLVPVTPQGAAIPVTIPEADWRYAGREPTAAPELPSAQLPPSGFSTERAQAIYGKDAVLITKGKSPAAWKEIGAADPRNAYDVLEQARARGIATPEDAAKLRDEHQLLLDRARQAYGTPEYTDLAQNAVDFLNASKEVVHGPASDLFRGLQEADEPKYTSPADFDNILRERMREATPEQAATFKDVADQVNNGETQARDAAANGQEALKTYKPNEIVPFDEAADYIRKQIKDLTEPCK